MNYLALATLKHTICPKSPEFESVVSVVILPIAGWSFQFCDYIYNKSDIWSARNTLGGLEISIRHEIINTLEMSAVLPHQIEVRADSSDLANAALGRAPASSLTLASWSERSAQVTPLPSTHKKSKQKIVKNSSTFNVVISVVKFQTRNTDVAVKNKIIIRYMYIYTCYARFFQCMFCLYLFLICRPLISFTNFIKSLSLLVTFLLNFRHGLSIDRSHVHLSIYKRSFHQEFQQISKWWSFANSLRMVGHIGLSHGCHVIWGRSLIGCLP